MRSIYVISSWTMATGGHLSYHCASCLMEMRDDLSERWCDSIVQRSCTMGWRSSLERCYQGLPVRKSSSYARLVMISRIREDGSVQKRWGISKLKRQHSDPLSISKPTIRHIQSAPPRLLRKIPAPIKIKSALPPAPQTQNPPPKNEEFYGHGGFPAEERRNSRRP